MPLIQGKSKKSFEKNVATEMKAHPDKKKQDLAIAYSIQRKNARKKMALGGATESNPSTPESEHENKELSSKEHTHSAECWVGEDLNCMYAEGGEVSASNEKRPMPDEEDHDKASADRQGDSKKQTADWMNVKSKEAQGSSSSKQRGPDWVDDDHQTADNDNDELGLDMYAEGGDINFHDEQEADADSHYASIADAILAKKRMRKMMADGGEVDLEANSEESPNEEDQMSFRANGKEQYDDSQISKQPEDSNRHAVMLDSDEHDLVERVRAKMKAKRDMQ